MLLEAFIRKDGNLAECYGHSTFFGIIRLQTVYQTVFPGMSCRKPIQYLVKFLDIVPLLSGRVFGESGGSCCTSTCDGEIQSIVLSCLLCQHRAETNYLFL